MKPMRKSSGALSIRATPSKLNNRVTKEDIRLACLRRWNGRGRITTDWTNLFQEPELCFPTGDVLVYLREPGQSSRGPAFRIHKAQIRDRGFGRILEKCIERVPLPGSKCMEAACLGCEIHQPPAELYIPAPHTADIDVVFDHHITTRNYFAWMYDLPLAGRALGLSLIALKDRIDFYRPGTQAQTAQEIVAFADSQRYLDFRECTDHALAALVLAESLKVEDLWVDAFAHCVGMSNREIHLSLEYPATSIDTRILINNARLELETRLDRVSNSIADFFESDLSGNFLGLPQPAREHFDRFRSWLHSYYIEQHGFWPPAGLSEDSTKSSIYSVMYSDFRNLYHHLVDSRSSNIMQNNDLAGAGGVCILQNLQAFNTRNRLEALPNPMPVLPVEPLQQSRSKSRPRRQSWNPITRRKTERDAKNALRTKALIAASNRDWQVMNCLLVRRYSEFEAQTILDETQTISMVNGRKVRWILIYAILQTLISVMQAPKQVRNTEGLSYSLCCHVPKAMPWQGTVRRPSTSAESRRQSRIEPDLDLIHSNLSSDLVGAMTPNLPPKSERRPTMISRVNSTASMASSMSPKSIRGLINRRRSGVPEVPPLPKPAVFCEILVEGYGNGLTPVQTSITSSPPLTPTRSTDSDRTPKASLSALNVFDMGRSIHTETDALSSSPLDKVPSLSSASSPSVSRESSNASNTSSSWSKNTPIKSSSNSDTDRTKPDSLFSKQLPRITSLHRSLSTRIVEDEAHPFGGRDDALPMSKQLDQIMDEHGFIQTLNFDTTNWDTLLSTT